jgi:hypothetical protein
MLKPLLYRSTLCLDRAVAHLPQIGRFRPLRGSFSALELLRAGKVQGAIIAESQPTGLGRPTSPSTAGLVLRSFAKQEAVLLL